ncbi:MAG: hypothetical protein FWC27_15155 [Firmicutes bacterium]|nr:hypothetical protein [Bacillota bacterium]
MKRKLLLIVPIALLVLAAGAAAIWTFSHAATQEPEETREYRIVPDEAFYPEGYVGYRYPVRPGTEIWGQLGYVGPGRLIIPEEVIARMTTRELAQSVVCYPWHGWQAEVMLSSRSEQPPDFVRTWFDQRFRDFPALQALAQRQDARTELAKLDGMYEAFSGPESFYGMNPRLILRSPQFGGAGIPDNAHKGE